ANRLSRKYRLAGYLGFQDEKGELAVAKRWAINNALGSGYPALLDDPEVVAAHRKWMPDERLLDDMKLLYEKAPWPNYYHATWWSEWSAKAVNLLVQAVAGQKPVKDAIRAMRTDALQLIDRYK
ncbi:MAG: extracellular solute-binding protein, partial [Firmicutes bacterium]|nr:extracellular solute-binding protein [Bacillota bacterium]